MTTRTTTEHIVAKPLALSIIWKNGKIARLHVRWATSIRRTENPSEEGLRLETALARYVAGEQTEWPQLPLDISQLSDFQGMALDALRRIPRGATRSYGELAALLGKPGGAQAVGRAMATNPFPLVYPCHRVIGANGAMTGFTAEGGVRLKKFLLELEDALPAKPGDAQIRTR